MELYANNVKIPFGGTLTIKFYNPLFNDIGSHSLPISISAKTPSVNKAFGFPNRQEAQGLNAISAKLKTGIIDLTGSWDVNNCTGDTIEASYKGGNGDFYSMIKNKLLTELSFGGTKYPAGVGANAATVLAYMTTKMDSVYPDNDWAAFMAYLSDPVDGMSEEVNPVVHANPSGVPSFTATVDLNSTVYLFAGTIIDYIFSEFGYRIEKNIFREDPGLKRLVVFNTFNRVTFIDAFNYTQLVPDVLISDFLKAIRNRFNIGFFVDEHSRTVKIQSFDLILSEGPAPGKIYASACKIDKNKISGISFASNPPDTWSSIAFTSLAQMDPLNTLVTVDKKNDVTVALAGKKVYVLAESAFYDVSTLSVITRLGPDLFPYLEGTTQTPVEQLSGILGMHTIEKNFETAVDYTVPYCDLKSNREGYPHTEMPLIFLLAHGIQDCMVYPIGGAYERQYPMGSTDIYDAKGDAIAGATLALKWDGTYGIIERFWANRIYWELYLKKIISTTFKVEDLSKVLDFSKIQRIGNHNYIINSITAEFSDKITRIKETELFRL